MVAKSGEMLYITHVGHFPDVIRLERYRSGHNEPHSKCGRQETGARVRIPFSPPTKRTNTLFVRFVFRHLIKGIRTRALRKRHCASFLAADRRLLQSIKNANQGCFAKDKNESLSYALNRDSSRCVAYYSCFGYYRLIHRLDCFFNKINFFLGKVVLFVELLIDFCNRF